MRARELRANATPAERILWRRLSARKVIGARFNRQVTIGPFTADLVCRAVKLVVEVDGGHHAKQMQADAARTRYLEECGYRVIRFWNNDVIENVEGVVAAIEQALRTLPSPSTSRKREGSTPPSPRERAGNRPSYLPSRLREGSGEGLAAVDAVPSPDLAPSQDPGPQPGDHR
ncbi:endonuclease domain-containing protein [uncultured Sphingomonas sp.]|uniref:endonuclease domain-containing protein n=1 Tax=uncultured Sphingomonas sp. TaxID=158754 RepID=UPI0035CC7B33